MKDFNFKIFNSTWTVSFVDKIELPNSEGFFFGHTNVSACKIQIAIKDFEGNPLPQTTIEITILHEMMHAIFSSGQYESATNDEPLVEWVANCLYSLKQQGKLWNWKV